MFYSNLNLYYCRKYADSDDIKAQSTNTKMYISYEINKRNYSRQLA